jgi:hypothetical protein
MVGAASSLLFNGYGTLTMTEFVPQVKRVIETVRSTHLTIDLPESFVDRRVEILVVTLDEPEAAASRPRRIPPPQFKGRVRELGDVMTSIPEVDWGISE